MCLLQAAQEVGVGAEIKTCIFNNKSNTYLTKKPSHPLLKNKLHVSVNMKGTCAQLAQMGTALFLSAQLCSVSVAHLIQSSCM